MRHTGILPLARDRLASFARSHAREALALGLLVPLAFAAGATLAHSAPQTRATDMTPASPPPMLLRNLAPDAALQINGATPIAVGPNPAASPFIFRGDSATREQALQCLTAAVYYEAGNQDEAGEQAVAQIVLNRVRHPAFPSSVCGVVYEGSTRTTGSQFTFTTDGSLLRPADAAGWERAYRVAKAALDGYVYAPVGWATHYHANYVLPYWASTLSKSAIVGAHIFYRWAGAWGRAAAFGQAYAGHEPDAFALRDAAVAAAATRATSLARLASANKDADLSTFQHSMRNGGQAPPRFTLTSDSTVAAERNDAERDPPPTRAKLKWTLSSSPSDQGE